LALPVVALAASDQGQQAGSGQGSDDVGVEIGVTSETGSGQDDVTADGNGSGVMAGVDGDEVGDQIQARTQT